MPTIPNPITLVGRAVRAFFKADVKLQRGRGGLQVVLDERAAAAAPRKAAGAADVSPQAREQRELRRMQASLTALLDQHAANRKTLRHLAFVEHALERCGQRAFRKLPPEVIRRALGQIEALVSNWSDEGLATLRSKLAVALIECEPAFAPPREGAATTADDAGADSVVDSAAPLAVAETLHGEEADEAEAALRAAYGSMALQGPERELTLEPAPSAERESEPAH